MALSQNQSLLEVIEYLCLNLKYVYRSIWSYWSFESDGKVLEVSQNEMIQVNKCLCQEYWLIQGLIL